MKRNTIVNLLLMAFLIALPCLAEAEGGSGRIMPSETDRSITNQIEKSLDGIPGQIAVDTTDGEVTLIGTVRDNAGMQQAVQRARAIPGVVSVNNEMRLDPNYTSVYKSTHRQVAVTDDASIAENLRYRMRTYPDVDTAVNNGTAVLSGEVESQKDSDRASRIAASVDGVKNVKNDIEVKMFDGSK